MFDANGLMYILDAGNSRIVRWTLGMSFGFTLIASSMNTPYSFALDYSNNFIVADSGNHRIISYSVMCGMFFIIRYLHTLMIDRFIFSDFLVPTTTAVSALPSMFCY